MKNQFSKRLRELRKNKKISQAKLSKYLGYGYTAVANYEAGRNEPSLDTLIQLSECFNVTVDYLIGKSEVPLSSYTLSVQEMQLLQCYHLLALSERQFVLDVMKKITK